MFITNNKIIFNAEFCAFSSKKSTMLLNYAILKKNIDSFK